MSIIFGGKDNDLSFFDKAKVTVVPVPYGRTVSYKKGTEHGPEAILRASDNIELFDEELLVETHSIGINTLAPLKVSGLKPEKMTHVVERSIAEVVEKNKFPVVLGGEHSITIGAVKALKKKYDELSVLYFDAHCDLRDTYNRSKYNHACVARRLLEEVNIVEVGIRSFSKTEHEFFRDRSLDVIKMTDMLKKKDWPSIVKEELSKDVYISIDLDVFDPSIMPSVGTPEPGGMKWYDFLTAIKDIIYSKNIVGLDVVELCPAKNMVRSDFLAARLVYKILGYNFFKKEIRVC